MYSANGTMLTPSARAIRQPKTDNCASLSSSERRRPTAAPIDAANP